VKRFAIQALAGIALATLTTTSAVAQHDHSAASERLGKVQFVTSCDAGLQDEFNQAVAVLHSFGYARARAAFTAIAEKDPTCAMAYWGMAMSHYHPLWEAPGRSDLERGSEAIEKANAIGAKTQRESDYIAALAGFYTDWQTSDHRKRALAYEGAMEKLQTRYADDREAKIFYALAVRGNAPPEDKTYANQKKAGAILEPIFAEQPEHPGLAHYIIHCYDYPALADRALTAARRYAKIAPDSPHALHMPSHIFTRLGLWDEDIQSNLASAAAARNQKLSGDELHARDYLVYAYLQKGQDRAAKQTVAEAAGGADPTDAAYFAALYALGAMPARYALERHDWANAAHLEIPALPKTGRYAWAIANIYLARALGSARTGRLEAAQSDVQQLRSLQQAVKQAGEAYWAVQVGIQAEIASAWVTQAQGRHEDGLQQMRAAADHEDATDKHPVTPGAIVPARELLGDMLVEARLPAEALAAYESVLNGVPNRFNALAGAARAAKLSGESAKAREFSSRLLQLASEGDGERPELQAAKTLLAEVPPAAP
jgi:hypothetical protein